MPFLGFLFRLDANTLQYSLGTSGSEWQAKELSVIG